MLLQRGARGVSGVGDVIGGRYRLAVHEPDVGLYEAWRAQDLHAGDATVRVELLPAYGEDAAFHALVRRLRSLSDVGMPRVIDGGRDGRAAWVVSEYDEGRALHHWLGGHRAAATLPSFGAAQRLFEKVGAAVRFAHEARDVGCHGGLCARNVQVRRTGAQHAVKVLGLGLAPQGGDGARSVAWERLWPYLAPERLTTRRAPTQADDLFALAVLLIEVLTARATPGTGAETWGALAQAPAGKVRDRLVALRDDVPAGVWDVILGALSPSVRERPASVTALMRALRDAWTAAERWEPPTASEREPPDPAPEPVERASFAPPGAAPSAAPIGWQVAEREPVRATPARPAPEGPPQERTEVLSLASEFLAAPSPSASEALDRTHAVALPVDDGVTCEDMKRPVELIASLAAARPSRALPEETRALDLLAAEDAPAADADRTRVVALPDDDDDATQALSRPAAVVAAVNRTEALSRDAFAQALPPRVAPATLAPRVALPGTPPRVAAAPSPLPAPTPARPQWTLYLVAAAIAVTVFVVAVASKGG